MGDLHFGVWLERFEQWGIDRGALSSQVYVQRRDSFVTSHYPTAFRFTELLVSPLPEVAGILTELRTCMSLLSRSNQTGAPSDIANALISQPRTVQRV